MSIQVFRGKGYAPSAPNESQLLIYHKNTPLNGTVPVILCAHAHNGDVSHYQPGVPTEIDPGWHVWMLAQAGYILLATDNAGPAAWSDAAAMARLDDAYAYAMAIGGKPGKVAMMGWSMGGMTTLNWIKRNVSKVLCAWLWAPVTDLDWARTVSNWTAEITADFPGGSAGYNIHDEPQSWRGIGVPMMLAHAPDDTVIPSTHTDTFVAAVNDPLVTKRVVSSGGHVDLFSHVPESETVNFYKAYA